MNSFSICLIAKNEEKNLENCLRPLLALEEEIVLVDTGSTDQTKTIAARLGAKVFDFTWVQDFSAARNYSISVAQNDWVLIVDCDELGSPEEQLENPCEILLCLRHVFCQSRKIHIFIFSLDRHTMPSKNTIPHLDIMTKRWIFHWIYLRNTFRFLSADGLIA